MKRLARISSALLLLGCEQEGELSVGAACGADEQCESGLCIAGVAGDDPACTLSCAADAECPEGWSCSGVTARSVVVCRRGGATPFGQ